MENKPIMSLLLEQIKQELGTTFDDIYVEDVRVGVVYSGVKITGGYGGIAATQPQSPRSNSAHCSTLPKAGDMTGMPASEVMEMALSDNTLKAVVGVATVNALATMICERNPEKYKFSDTDVLDLIKPGDNVGMVGHFSPMIPRILKITEQLTVIEKKDIFDERINVVQEHEAAEVISGSDVVIITASTLVNGTTDELITMKGKARETILLGPSAVMLPQPFYDKGFTAVMGTRINDTDTMLKVVSEAGGTKHLLKKCGEKFSFVK
ncbi:Rossmann-like domain-containing protein [Methanococcoides sp. FTZ1]|uniref:Rossmann-like domain-containing protein n=1 Tax=Methanococcoides sp. FTZ1 TaxID=3439061 RepID=UPI003F859E4F